MSRAMGASVLSTQEKTDYNQIAADCAHEIATADRWFSLLTRADLNVDVGEAYWALPSDFKPEPYGSVAVYFRRTGDADFSLIPIEPSIFFFAPAALPPVVDSEASGGISSVELLACQDAAAPTDPVAWYLHSPDVKAESSGVFRVHYYRDLPAATGVTGWLVPSEIASAIKTEAVARLAEELSHVSAVNKRGAADRAMAVARSRCSINTVNSGLQLNGDWFYSAISGGSTEGGRE